MIAEDSFESYPAGTTVLGLNGGSGWAGPWVGSAANTFNAVDTSANPLVFTPAGGNPIYGGGRAAEIAAVGNQTNSRALPSPLPDSFYAAYMVRVAAGQWTDTDTFSIHFANTPYNTGTPNFGLRGPGTFMIRIGTGAPAATNVLSGSTALGDVNYLVVRFSKLDGNGNPTPTYDRFELWLNPAVGDEVAFPNGQVRMQLAAGSGLPTFSHILVRVAALEAGDAVHLDQLILADSWAEVINPILPPSITDLTPTDGTTFWPWANGISFRASSTQPIDPVGIALVLNGTDVSAGLQIGGDPTLRMVFFDGLLPNTLYVAEVGVSNLTGSTKQTIRFDTFSDTEAVVVEVEDYNYELWGECDHVWGALRTGTGGTFQDNPLPSGYDLSTGQKIGSPQTGEGYVDAVGCPEVDYHDASNVAMNPVLSVYRYCDFVGTRLARDYRRQKYVSFNLPEYEVFQMVSGDWMNYTRTFTPTNYKVYLRVAGSVPGQVQLGKVSGDASGPDQTVTPAGLFLLPNTGGANRYGYVAMTDATGQNEVTVALAGVSTVRLTSLGTDTNTGLNYLVFVPASASRIPPVVDIVAPTNGAEYPAGATIPVSVTASDPDGSVTNITISVSTLNSTNVLAVFGSSPASFSWSNVTDGIYTLTATATDNDGLKGLAMPVTIKVGNPPRPALFVVGPVPLGSGDAAVVDRLRFLGLPVVVKTAVEATSADADDKALVVISSTVLSGDVGTKFTASATPVLQWESALNDEFLLSATGGNLAGQDSIVITSEGAAHPLGAGLPEGTVVVRTTPTTFHTASDLNLAPGAIVIARAASPDNTSPVILAVDAGGILNNGSPAPARRVSMFWGNEGLDNVNAVGLSLFDAAVNWALGRISVRPKLHIARVGDTVIVSWPASISGETLQENSDLANPAGWVNSTRTIETEGTTKFVTIPAPSGNLFFRLVK